MLLSVLTFAVVILLTAMAIAAEPSPLQAEFTKAVSRGEHDKIHALIVRGADVNAETAGFTPLMLARDTETIRLLVEAGANVNARSTVFRQTMLGWAANEGKLDIVKALIEAGADVNAKDDVTGATALSAAIMVRKPRIDIIKTLLDAGADPNKGLVFDQPLLVWASTIGNVDVIKVLIDGGADVGVRNKKGATPLMAAVAAKKTEAAKLLIAAGADVNARTKGATGKRGDKSKTTAMDVAAATGDDEITAMLKKVGAKESDKPPVPDYKVPNSPGMYSLPCRISGSPPPQGAKFSCSGVDQVAASGTETLVISKAYFAGKHAVPMEKGCLADFGQPGFYTIKTTTISTPWELVCRSRLRTTTGGEKWIAFIRKGKTVIKTSEHKAVMKKPEKKAPEEEKETPGIRIVQPVDGDQFAFNADNPNALLEIKAEAEVTGDCDEAATWKMEDIGESKKKIDPDGVSDEVTITFKGLPVNNSDFGKKKITAHACGKSDTVIVDIFFPAEEKNHPDKGNGETPNWFYYWGQTRAGKGFSPEFMEKHPCGNNAVGTYWFDKDKIALYPATFQGVCFERTDGSQAKGIDCYAETLIHESIHQRELKYWWYNIPTEWGDIHGMASKDSGILAYIFPAPIGCDTSFALTLNRGVRNWIMSIDSDGDLVPDYIENGLAGCDANNAFSCPGVPSHVMRKAKAINHKIDVDMNTYRISWKKWKIGSADKEDWSKCGKQWKDRSVCSP